MSARTSTTGPGFDPSRRATTPVPPTPVCTSRPSAVQFPGDNSSGADFLEPEFRMGMKITAHGLGIFEQSLELQKENHAWETSLVKTRVVVAST